MIDALLQKIFGSANERNIKKYKKIVDQINALEDDLIPLSDAQLREKTGQFQQRLSAGEALDALLPEAFAVVREASKRVLGMRPFDVQLLGGIVLHKGMIAEMRTGEGKTLAATLPVYLNALTGQGVHVITVNDYLAQRDSEWMGQLYSFLGLSCACIVHGLNDTQRQQAYACDITYGTNHEFGFDYLRDHMKFRLSDLTQRSFNYAIVDEVDSILIDEARTPLIISGSAEDSSDLYIKVNKVVPQLQPTHYEKDEKQRSVTLNEAGTERIEILLREADLLKGETLYDIQNMSLVHHVNQALRAHVLFTRDIDYIVKDDKVIIIDEFTGRMMDGRRYSEGLHQALEAKEGVTIEMENQTLASITYQNFFRLYPKLGGMTGTASTEAAEFEEIYKLAVVRIPTNKSIARIDHEDAVYLTAKEKYDAVIALIQECKDRQQPVLVGTASIEQSELVSNLLKKEKITHQVLNARYHGQEALIIADAGEPGAVTIATNMAGRGTDIKLGGNRQARIERETSGIIDEQEKQEIIDRIDKDIHKKEQLVREAGGLFVIGTERHESRRIDNQLRGRSGRQGDPGASKFFISLQDDLMRIFGSDRLDAMLRRLGVQEGEAISHAWITRALERAQQKVEARNFDIRKHLLQYDDVMNDQRKLIYEQRRELMATQDIQEITADLQEACVNAIVARHIAPHSLVDQWDVSGLVQECQKILAIDIPLQAWVEDDGITEQDVKARILQHAGEHYQKKEAMYPAEILRSAERNILLRMLDQCWKDHLLALDHLRQGINLRAYAQGNPLHEYKREAFILFEFMITRIQDETITFLSHFTMDIPTPEELESVLMPKVDFGAMEELTPLLQSLNTPESTHGRPNRRQQDDILDPQRPETWGRIQRNALCPCGSNKKYKHCHGRITGAALPM